MMTNWRNLISEELQRQKETWTDVFSCTLLDSELDVEFDAGYGLKEGKSFTLWTHDRVYFPVQCHGKEWVSSVSRLPDGKATEHVGGGG